MSNQQPSKKRSRAPFTSQKRWHQAHPMAAWAHMAFQSALRRGLIERRPCAVCGAEPADFHHNDGYDRPLVGEFLCRRHHRQQHAALRREAR